MGKGTIPKVSVAERFTSNGSRSMDASRCAELLQAAAGDDELQHIARLAQRWILNFSITHSKIVPATPHIATTADSPPHRKTARAIAGTGVASGRF